MSTSAHELLPIVLLALYTATLLVLLLYYHTVSTTTAAFKAAHHQKTTSNDVAYSKKANMKAARSKYEASYVHHDVLISFLCMSAAYASHTRHYFATDTAVAATTAAASFKLALLAHISSTSLLLGHDA
eukprot:11960-Heterococcus_DN1.PRE.4